jgi:hypothetical protein
MEVNYFMLEEQLAHILEELGLTYCVYPITQNISVLTVRVL